MSVSAKMSSVDLCLHQDAILDLAKEASVWVNKIQNKASKLMGPVEDPTKKRISGGIPGNQDIFLYLVK